MRCSPSDWGECVIWRSSVRRCRPAPKKNCGGRRTPRSASDEAEGSVIPVKRAQLLRRTPIHAAPGFVLQGFSWPKPHALDGACRDQSGSL